MATHLDDEQELENLKQWWRENWVALAGGLVLGLGAIFGWEGWKRYQTGQAMQASQMYEDMKQAYTVNKGADAQALAERLVTEFPKTPYAANAALRLAAVEASLQKYEAADSRLQWVIKNSSDDGLRDLAQLRRARVLVQQNKLDEALKLADAKSGAYEALFDELRGDIKLAQGDRAAARAAYEKALSTAKDDPGTQQLLQLKLDDLADAAVQS